MDYILFVFCVAVMASILGFCWYRFFMMPDGTEDLRASRLPAHPLKNTISGLSEKEIERIELQSRIDIWQQGMATRKDRPASEAKPPASGQKYVFTPPAESRAGKIRRRSTVVPIRQRFELVR